MWLLALPHQEEGYTSSVLQFFLCIRTTITLRLLWIFLFVLSGSNYALGCGKLRLVVISTPNNTPSSDENNRLCEPVYVKYSYSRNSVLEQVLPPPLPSLRLTTHVV